ncbi:syntaxin-132 [Selaginella moellendorffii]|nr:syntaxin-132 [Selaginella moellendorffii]|eukprot:XP_002991810.2 syntaxin-132 [Selaginella moellendorffii]
MNDLLGGDGGADLEAGQQRQPEHGSDKLLGRFFDEVGKIKSDMERLKMLLGKLQAAHEESKTIHKAKAMKALRQRMDKDIEEVLVKAKLIKDEIQKLDRSNIASRQVGGCEEGTPTDRTRTVITANLKKNLQDVMAEFQKLRHKITGEYRDTLIRRFFTVTGKKPDDETVDYILETGESESFLQRAIQDQGRGQIVETIREIQERHDAVKTMEKNLLELQQIFLDISVLVESQGEQLNSIEHQVHRAAAYVEQGAGSLRGARKIQRSSRKCMCIAIVLLLVVILVVAAPVIFKLKKN